ncbi:MAG: class E sortase [Pseudolysinimonas sp.]
MNEPGDSEPTVAPAEQTSRPRSHSRTAKKKRPRRRVSVVGVLGELLITAGVLVLLFLGWQQWLGDIIVGNQLYGQSVQQSQQWIKAAGPTKNATVDPAAPPVITASLSSGKVFGYLYIPRFGSDYARPIAQGTSLGVLNKGNLGHYPTTQMPGAVGNFMVASHRKAYGGDLEHINNLRVGDHIFVGTADGWYQYTFRNLQFVTPTDVAILDPVPDQPGLQPGDRIITLQSCNPFFSTAERIMAYGTFDTFYPIAGGPPAEIAATVKGS